MIAISRTMCLGQNVFRWTHRVSVGPEWPVQVVFVYRHGRIGVAVRVDVTIVRSDTALAGCIDHVHCIGCTGIGKGHEPDDVWQWCSLVECTNSRSIVVWIVCLDFADTVLWLLLLC